MHSPNTCVNCGRPTTNPRFCNRGCAASYNNRQSPKRQSKRRCRDCGAVIHSRQQRCSACAARAEEARRRQAANIQTFLTPTGERREVPVQTTWVSRAVVFESYPPGGRTFKECDPCGDFLDVLVGLAFARPEYIREEDIFRYASLVDAFRAHVVAHGPGHASFGPTPVTELPLAYLQYALRHWIESLLLSDCHPLLPSYALDAARFISAHAEGVSRGEYAGEAWRINKILERDPENRWSSVDRLDDPRLKKEITEKLCRLSIRCAVPPGGRVLKSPGVTPLLGPGEFFVFTIERCHLSSGVADFTQLHVEEEISPRFDIADELNFRGQVLLEVGGDASAGRPLSDLSDQLGDAYWLLNESGLSAEIPLRWVVEVYDWDSQKRELRRLPVPRWKP